MDEIKELSAEEIEKLKFAAVANEFAKTLNKQTIYNPADSSTSRKTRSYSKYTPDQIIGWLQNPVSNEKNLRDASIYLFQTSTRYRRLITSLADMPLWYYVISPLNFNSQKVRPDSFKKSYQKIVNALELMNVADEYRKILTTCLRNGVYYGVRWNDSQSAFMQQLDPDYCVITHISDGTFLFAFDCSQLKTTTLANYPPQFTTMYNDYQSSGQKWQMVPPEISVCLKADPTTIEYSIPPFSGVFPALYNIAASEDAAQVAEELDNYKMLHGQIETDDKGVPAISFDDAYKYYKLIADNLSPHVGFAFSPFKITDFSFDRAAGATDVDLIARSVDNFWSTAGSSSVLHGAANSTAGVTKLSLVNEWTFVFALVQQCERIINRYLKENFGGVKFKITFLPVSAFNVQDYIDMYKSGLNYGYGKLYYAAALGIPTYDLAGLSYIENDVLGLDNLLSPLQTAATRSSDDAAEDGGRPAEDETDLDATGESTRENDTNANR